MSKYNKACVVCGDEWTRWGRRSDARFCSDKCRDDWNNAHRKLKRKHKRIVDLIWEIDKMHDDKVITTGDIGVVMQSIRDATNGVQYAPEE